MSSYNRDYIPEQNEDGTVRLVPVKSSVSTRAFLPAYTRLDCDPGEAHRLAVLHSARALETFRERRQLLEGITRKTLDQYRRDIDAVLAIPVPDPALGCERTLTIFDFLRPGFGAALVVDLKRELLDLGLPEPVVDRLLRGLRVVCRHLIDNPVVDGIDLREIYGAFACPIGDREIRKHHRDVEVRTPTRAELGRVCEASHDWVLTQRRRPYQAARTGTIFVSSCSSALRGKEQRDLDLGDQVFDRTAATPRLENPIHLLTTKTKVPRNVVHDPFGLAMVNYWLGDVRPLIAPPTEGRVYPGIGHGSDPFRSMTSAAFSSSMGRLLVHLKELGVIHRNFTFHWTRKTFATLYLEEGGTLAGLMARGGWQSVATVSAYVKPHLEAVESADRAFRRTAGRRR